jgi:hypothetical protein
LGVDQNLYNIAMGVAAFLGGWWMKVMWEALKDLQKADKELVEKVGSIEVLVAGHYIKREDFDRVASEIFAKLDKINDKLDRKADKA